MGNSCIHTFTTAELNFLGTYDQNIAAAAANAAIDQLGAVGLPLITSREEDSLFLDVYVPGKIITNPSRNKLSAINWTYGGAVSTEHRYLVSIHEHTALILHVCQ
jgi:hypothetical protein